MKFAVRLLVLGLLVSMYFAAPAAAQYMRITTDNPSDNTRLNASGTTILTITLDTNHDKDGTLQTCNSHAAALCGGTGTASALTLFSYQVYLTAVGGTVTWGTFVPADAAFTPLQPQVSNATDVEFTFARPPGSTSPAGLNTLGNIPVTIVTGAPRVDIARFPNNPLDASSFGTSFGTQCDGNVIGNTYILGNADDPCGLVSLLPPDWFDADGAGPPAGSNSAPTLAQLTNMTIDEGATADQTLNATDPDNDPITFSLVTGPSFVTVTTTTPGTGTATGNLHLAPGFADDGTYSVTVRATDNATGTDDQTLSITVNNINRAPVITQPANMTVDEGETADQTITATDQDGEPLTFTRTAGPTFFSVTTTTPGTGSATGNIHLAPGHADAVSGGTSTFTATVRASDGTDFDEASFTISVNDVDRPVVLNAVADMIVNAGATADQAFTASDADGDGINLSHTGPAFMTRTDDVQVGTTRTGTIHLAPPLGTTGTFAASVTASANVSEATENFVITITGGANVAPILTEPANMTVNEGATADQVLNATDDEGNPITFTLVTGPAFATVTTTSPGTGTATGNLHLAPDFTDAGTYSATVRASDGTANDDATLTITVNDTNRAPTLTQPADMTVTEGATADQTLTAVDADDQPLTFTMLSGPTFATVTTTTPGTGTGTGNLHLAPGSTDSGTYSVTVRVSDGTANDDATLSITVNNLNHDPVLEQPANMTVDEGATANQTLNATDSDGDPLTFTLVTGPTFATVTTTSPGTGTATGNLNLAPGFGDSGTYSATVRASDGTANDDATLSITVNDVPQPPSLNVIADMSVAAGATADQGISATDADGDQIDFTFTGPAFMTVTSDVQVGNTRTGNIHLAPPVGTTGTFAASVTATAGGQTATDDFVINVTETNAAPVLTQPADMTVNEAATADQALNATDSDGNPLSFTLVSGPTFATVTTTSPGTGTATGNLNLSPSFADAGTYSATIRVSDGSLSDDATLSITVNNVNRAPALTAVADMTVTEGATADQTLNATDADGDPLTFTLASGPTFATVTTTTPGTGTATGNLHLAPGTGDAGTFAASVTVSDGTLSETDDLVITVNEAEPGNVAPVLIQPTDMTVDEGATANQILNATDANGDPLTFTLVTGPTFATVTTTTPGSGTAAGNLNLAPGFGDAGTYSATVRVSDGALSDDATLSITVNNVNRAPVLTAVADMTVTEGATADQTLNATDPDGDPLTFTLASGPTFATVTTTTPGTGTATGNLHLAPGTGDAGTYNASVTVSDGTDSNTDAFIITVNEPTPGNVAPVLTQPTDMTVNEGATANQILNATDANGDPLSFTLVTGPTFATVTTTSPGTGTATGNLNLAPGFGDAGTYSVTVRVSDGALSDDATLSITVNDVDVNQPPVADAGGPYTGTVNVAVNFNGTGSSDPDGDALTYSWDFDATDGITQDATGPTPTHTYTAPGTYTVTLTVTDDGTPALSDTDTATATISPAGGGLQAEAVVNGGNRVIVLDSPRPFWCVYLSSNSFDVSDVVESSVQASYGGVQIPALRTQVQGDDQNGEDSPGDDVERLRICFSKDQLRILFASLAEGSQSVDVLITGSLSNGATFQATVEVAVVKGGQGNQAMNGNNGNGKAKGWHRASPNPFNPNTTISFELSRPGTVRLQIYDVTGRLVKTLANEFRGSGVHTVSWNGMSRNGSRVSSGVYFYVLQTPEHRVKSQLVVMK